MVQVGVTGGRGHLTHPQGEGHPVPRDPGRGACRVSSFSLSFLSFSPYFSSSPVVNNKIMVCNSDLLV